MKTTMRLVWWAALAAAVAAPGASAQPMTEQQKHLEAATRNTGGDLLLFETWRRYYCMYAEDNQTLRQAVRDFGADQPLTQIFDDAWFVGTQYIGTYIFRSSSGFMLLDTMNGANDMITRVVPALQSLGMGPSMPLAGVYITHGHGDHDGGALYLRQTFGTGFPILLGSADAGGKPYSPTPIDSTNLQPQAVTLAGRSLTLLSTPGHTNGSLTAVIPVRDNGKDVKVLVVGGSAMPTNAAGARNYLDGTERTYTLARQAGVVASLHPHPAFDASGRNFLDINARGRGKPSQFILGEDRNHVPYKGAADVRTAIISQQIDVAAINVGEALQAIKGGGAIRNLGQMSPARTNLAPDLPTFKEQGYDIELSSLRGVGAPKGLPADLRGRLVTAVERAVADPEFQKQAAQYYAPLRYLAPSGYAKVLREAEADFQKLWKAHPWAEK